MNKIPFSVYDFFGYLASGVLVLAAFDFVFLGGSFISKNHTFSSSIVLIVVVYVLGHLVAHLSSVILEHGFLRKVLRSPEVHMLNEIQPSRWQTIFPGNFHRLPEDTKNRIQLRAKEDGVKASGRGLFVHCHAVVKRDESTNIRLNSFLNLYGFCRNTSMAGLIVVILFAVGSFIRVPADGLQQINLNYFFWAVVVFVASAGMFYRYLKFFRHYTQEVFVSYASGVGRIRENEV